MKRLQPFASTAPVAVCSSATALPFPPTVAAVLPSTWSSEGAGLVPEADLSIWATGGALNLTSAEAFGGVRRALTVADTTFTTTHAAETLTAAGHGLLTGDGPIQLSNVGGALPAGFSAATDYYVIKVDANTIKLASTLANAYAGTAVAISGDGTGTHTLADTASTKRVYWQSHGLLGAAGDGAIALDLQRSYVVRMKHHPATELYAIAATLSTETPEVVHATVTPVHER